MISADDTPMVVSWFECAGAKGQPAFGDPERTTWSELASVFTWRREGDKDGCCFGATRFKPEPDGRHVRRLSANVLARTAIVLDIETSKQTGEVPPELEVALDRAKALGLAVLGYTSHSHCGGNTRYRLVLPLSAEIDPALPAPVLVAEQLGLAGVIDKSKINAAAVFYLPSMPWDCDPDRHQTIVLPGNPIDSTKITATAGAVLAARQAEADRAADEAQAEAAARRDAKLAAGFDPDDSLIEKIRSRLDLDSILTSHGYDKQKSKYRHPNSSSGSYGTDIKTLGGVERVFSHNGTDPLHRDNLPEWCDGLTAVDAFDVTVILDFGGDRTRAIRELGGRFGLIEPPMPTERKALAVVLFRLIRQQTSQTDIEAIAFSEGRRLGLSRDAIYQVSIWVDAQVTGMRVAA